MILECTECRTRYLVPDSAIGADGRTVRCASCKHSWHQPGVVLDLVARAEAPAMAPAQAQAHVAVVAPPREPAYAAAAAPAPTTEAEADEDYDPFAHRAPFRPRRNPAKQWTAMALAAGVAMVAGIGALLYSDAPSIASMFGIPMAAAETPLTLIANKPDRRELLSGSELFAVSGKVVNPTDTRQNVPDIRAELRDAQGRLVFSWTIRPEANVLPPRGTVEFNSAKLDVPVSSEKLVLSFSGAAAS